MIYCSSGCIVGRKDIFVYLTPQVHSSQVCPESVRRVCGIGQRPAILAVTTIAIVPKTRAATCRLYRELPLLEQNSISRVKG